MMDQELREHVIRLRRQGRDDALVEAKAAGGGVPKSVWQTISAFANTDGGLIILGLDEQTEFSPAEGFDPQRILDALHSGLDDSHSADPKVLPIPLTMPSTPTSTGRPWSRSASARCTRSLEQ